MDYFKEIPVVVYPSFENENNPILLTNILARSAFLREVVENTAVYYEYSVKDGETAEIIADKIYGDPQRRWIVLLFNLISDSAYGFPLTTDELESYIYNKYPEEGKTANTTITVSMENAKSNTHHYEQKIKRTVYYNGIEDSSNTDTVIISALQQNSTTGIAEATPSLPNVSTPIIVADSVTDTIGGGITVTTTKTNYWISKYDHEASENETRRKIRLLDPSYVAIVETELRRLMRG